MGSPWPNATVTKQIVAQLPGLGQGLWSSPCQPKVLELALCALTAHGHGQSAGVVRFPLARRRQNPDQTRGEIVYELRLLRCYTGTKKGMPGSGFSPTVYSARLWCTSSSRKTIKKVKTSHSTELLSCKRRSRTWGTRGWSPTVVRGLEEDAYRPSVEPDGMIRCRGRRGGAWASKPRPTTPWGQRENWSARNHQVMAQSSS
jgi:hypothetical protein